MNQRQIGTPPRKQRPESDVEAFLNLKIPPAPKKPEQREKPEQPKTTNQEIPKDWVYIKPANLSFSPEITLKNLNWYDTHKEILKPETFGRMPTTAETWQAILYARQNLQLKTFYDSILKTTTTGWHGEWQNDFFTEEDGKMYIQHLIRFEKDKPVFSQKKEITDFLTKDGWNFADISSQDKITSEGLCKKLSQQTPYQQGQNIYFYKPTDQRVVRFDAGAVDAGLNCDRDPDFTDGSLGVFVCCEAARVKK